jgi:hypothetical protein
MKLLDPSRASWGIERCLSEPESCSGVPEQRAKTRLI